MKNLVTAEQRAANNQRVANHAAANTTASGQGAANQASASNHASVNHYFDIQSPGDSSSAAASPEPASPAAGSASASAGTAPPEPSSSSVSPTAQAIQAATATLQSQINNLRTSLDAVQDPTINADTRMATLAATLSAGLTTFEETATGYQAHVMAMDQRLTRLEVKILVRLPPLYASCCYD
jgi:hypothetical protein